MNIIPKEELNKNTWYLGHGRSQPVAYWTGEEFLSVGHSCGCWQVDYMEYGARGFDPIKEIKGES